MPAYSHLPGPPGSLFYFFPQLKAFLIFVERDFSFLLAPVLSWFISIGISKCCGIRWTLPASSCWFGSSRRRSWREIAMWLCSYILSCVGVVDGVAHLEVVGWVASLSHSGGGGFHRFMYEGPAFLIFSIRRKEENSNMRPVFDYLVLCFWFWLWPRSYL